MENLNLTFLSSQGRRMSDDLILAKQYLSKNTEIGTLHLQYYLKNERSENETAGMMYSEQKLKFCKGMEDVICVDSSLSVNMKKIKGKQTRLLLAAPYDYQFKRALLLNKKPDTKPAGSFRKFTHIVPGSPFAEKLFADGFRLNQYAKVHTGYCLPFVWELQKKETEKEYRDLFDFSFSHAKGKKIFSILTFGDVPAKKDPFAKFPLKEYLKSLDEDWFIVTNNSALLEHMLKLSYKYSHKIGYIDKIFKAKDLLFFSDVLLTNSGRMAASFATRKKPVYVISYTKNFFEQYTRKLFPNLYLSTAMQLLEENLTTECSAWQRQFYELFSYDEPKCPYELLDRLFIKKDPSLLLQ